MPEMNKVYVLNPHYHLRHDIHRVALFSSAGTDTDCSRNWPTFIHPLQAVMLSFFTYDRPLQTTLPLLCDFFCRSKEEMFSDTPLIIFFDFSEPYVKNTSCSCMDWLPDICSSLSGPLSSSSLGLLCISPIRRPGSCSPYRFEAIHTRRR